jgi:hypothetical protein
MKIQAFFQLCKCVKEVHKTVEDDERRGHLRSHRTTEDVEKFQNLVHSDKHLSVSAMAVQLNLDKNSDTD